MILPVVINSYLSKTYQITYFSLFNNILDNLNPLYFFCIVIQSDWLLTFVTLNDFLLQNCGGRKKSSSNIWHDLRNYIYCKCKNVNLGRFSPKKYCQPHILKRSNPFLNLLDTLTLRETNKVHLSHKEEGYPNHGFALWKVLPPSILQIVLKVIQTSQSTISQ